MRHSLRSMFAMAVGCEDDKSFFRWIVCPAGHKDTRMTAGAFVSEEITFHGESSDGQYTHSLTDCLHERQRRPSRRPLQTIDAKKVSTTKGYTDGLRMDESGILDKRRHVDQADNSVK